MSNMSEIHRQLQTGETDPRPEVEALKAEYVNHPSHYNQGKVECIEALESALTPEEFRGFCKGNALKYLWREKAKGGAQDLEKAKWYLDRLKGIKP